MVLCVESARTLRTPLGALSYHKKRTILGLKWEWPCSQTFIQLWHRLSCSVGWGSPSLWEHLGQAYDTEGTLISWAQPVTNEPKVLSPNEPATAHRVTVICWSHFSLEPHQTRLPGLCCAVVLQAPIRSEQAPIPSGLLQWILISRNVTILSDAQIQV